MVVPHYRAAIIKENIRRTLRMFFSFFQAILNYLYQHVDAKAKQIQQRFPE